MVLQQIHISKEEDLTTVTIDTKREYKHGDKTQHRNRERERETDKV